MRFSNRITSVFFCLIFVTSLALVPALGQTSETDDHNPDAVAAKVDSGKTAMPAPDNAKTKVASDTKSKTIAESLLHRIGINAAQTKSLSLNDAIRLALDNNNEIEVARSDVKIAESNLRSLYGYYDPTIGISPLYTNSVQAQPNIFGGAGTEGVLAFKTLQGNANLTHFLKPGGGNYNVFFNNSKRTTSSTATTLNPSYISQLGISFTQPILRNREIDSNRRLIKIQRRLIAQSDADFRRQTIDIVSRVQRAYWDLVFALRDQQNRNANLNLSKENLQQIEARIAAGAAAPLQKAEVSAELANRESDVLVASQQVSITENILKGLILKEPNSLEWSDSIVPTDSPVFSSAPVNLDNALKDAVANRPELKRLSLQSEINKIDLSFYKNQTLPKFDLNASYSLDGLAGTAAEGAAGTSVNSVFVGGYRDSVGNLFSGDYRTYSVGFTISIPVTNKTAKANLATARYDKEKLAASTRAQEQLVIAEVRNAVQAVETARQRVLTSRRARENASIQLDGERKLFDVGRSTTFLLFQRENSLTNARNAEIRSETDYNKALADLQKATSTTFAVNNIVVDSPRKTGN